MVCTVSLSLSLFLGHRVEKWLFLYNPTCKLHRDWFIFLFLFSSGDGQVGFEEFVTLLGPKLSSAGMPDKFHGADFDSVFWKVNIISQVYMPFPLSVFINPFFLLF